jgi:levanase/fructan beta-fructosidase
MNEFAGLKGLALDIHVNGDYSKEGLNALTCWENMKLSDTFDMKNREQYRPDFHHTPVYGWMNDPNGMFYKDGVWNLYFQYNPYGSQWENMTWGHSTSTDLVHWKFQGAPIQPDAIGTIFSGSAVVDKNNTAGLGKGAVVALYTSAGENQTQSMAYSTDNGKTFTKYEGNPIITSNVPDFRDPHMFWNEDIKKWNMILAAGQHMEIYSSDNLKDWKYESSFGEKYGNHGGVWECPDLMKMKVRGTDKEKWMLICNINPGGPSGGSATQYFVGDFDGHKFTCDSKPEVTKWMDYGKDHYATVTFDNAPEGRHVAIAWMSNWQYANQVPTQQYRSGNSIPRDLGLFEYKGETYCSVVPSPEMTAARSKKAGKKLTESCEMVVNLKGNATITLSNDKGEKVVMNYDAKAETFSMDRTKSGKMDFSKDFAAVTKAPTYGNISQLRIFIDKSSIEALDADGKMSMTNLVFPSKPYNKVTVKGKGKYQVYDIK